MKTKPSAIKSLLAAALAASCLASYAAAPQKREMKFEKLRKEFADPPRAFRPAPLWVWNTRVTRADIDRMLGDFKAQGFGGAFVHPRPGLVTEYLSDEWFDLYKYSVEKGKELGLDIWIYDENSYPSGHVPAQMPESYDQGQGRALTKTALPPADAGKYFLCLKKEGGTFRDITADTGRYKDVPGEYYLYEKTYYGRSGWHGGYSYVALLVEGVTEKFLDITMSGYEKTFGNELGPVIRGLFSDEPCIPSSGGVRWTPDLFEVFRKQWGYDLATSLPLLSEQTGDWKQVRHNYLETLTQMFVDRWAKPMSAYCDRKGMLWTGHYWEHDWPSMYQGGDLTKDELAAVEVDAMKMGGYIESENKIESMLKAQGFEDALCYLSDSSANIIVKTPGLDAAGAAKIKSTLLSEAEFTNDQITIVEVN